MILEGVAKREVRVHLVAVPAPDPLVAEVAGGLEFGDDALGGPLGDAHPLGDFPQQDVGIVGDAEHHVCVVGEEGPSIRCGHQTIIRQT